MDNKNNLSNDSLNCNQEEPAINDIPIDIEIEKDSSTISKISSSAVVKVKNVGNNGIESDMAALIDKGNSVPNIEILSDSFQSLDQAGQCMFSIIIYLKFVNCKVIWH